MRDEFKSFRIFNTKAASSGSDDRTRVGVCAVFGVIDDYGDRIHPGAFTKTISEGRQRHKHLWQHGFDKPPIASIKQLREVGRDELPPEVRAYAPEATGGLEVTREYYAGNELADWVLHAIDAGDITEMSFGFDPVNFDFTTEGEGATQIRIRELRGVRLYDTSDVHWGMNPATIGAIKGADVPLELLAANITRLATQIREGKAGRRDAANDERLFNAIRQAIEPEGADAGKAGTAPQSIPLSKLMAEITDLEISTI